MIEIVSWGIGGSVQGHGTLGRASLGVSRGGAVDVESLSLANRLVGNPEACLGLESSGGLQVRVGARPVMVALTGGVADISVDGGPPLGWGAPVVLPAGAVLRIGRLFEGTRVYLAVRGGLHPPAKGALAVVHVGPDTGVPAAVEAAVRRLAPTQFSLWPGPRLDWFDGDAWVQLLSTRFQVSGHGNRVGVRLSGQVLGRRNSTELPSEGVVEGAMQVPPDGRPIVMLADHPTTGGYPVVAVVDPTELGALSQLVPGSPVRFRAAQRLDW